jgi:Zn-dependent protease
MTPPSECPQCGTHWAAGILTCPGCGRLVHASTLAAIAAEAAAAEKSGDRPRAIGLWRAALSLLPAAAGQRQTIAATIVRIEREQVSGAGDQAAIESKSKSWRKWLGVGAPAAAFLATKGKFLILGLTKLPTLASMLVFMSVYWERWGWGFALGFVLCIYIHEMGHVITLKHYGIPATAPLFIPGFGAVIFAKQHIDSPAEDARVGLAGPAAGLLAALACLALYTLTGNKLFLALTVFGAYINLFNLIPILFLDGSRGYRGLSRSQRWGIAGIAMVSYFAFASSLSLGIAAVMAARQLFWKSNEPDPAPDWQMFGLFAGLLLVLAALANVPAPTPQELARPKKTALANYDRCNALFAARLVDQGHAPQPATPADAGPVPRRLAAVPHADARLLCLGIPAAEGGSGHAGGRSVQPG